VSTSEAVAGHQGTIALRILCKNESTNASQNLGTYGTVLARMGILSIRIELAGLFRLSRWTRRGLVKTTGRLVMWVVILAAHGRGVE
jgi:hypothetical protein